MRENRWLPVLFMVLLLAAAIVAGWKYFGAADLSQNRAPLSEIEFNRGAAPPPQLISPYEPGAPIPEKSKEDFQVVKVYYATDRARADMQALKRAEYRGNCRLTWVFCAVTFVLMLTAFALPRRGILSRSLRSLTWVGLVLSVIWAGWSTYNGWQLACIDPQGKCIYGGGRGSLELGVCEVSVPTDPHIGTLRSPSILRFEFREDPKKHVILQEVTPLAGDVYFEDLKKCVLRSPRRQAFVFIHGFRTPFAKAAGRTARLCYDLNFKGAPICYSWPSQGDILGYSADEANTVWTRPHLKQFLMDLAERSGADSIHLIAHSMGNRVLAPALKELSYECQDRLPLFNEVVLTAPDIDAEVFRRDIAPAILGTARCVTLYASSHDTALEASQGLHGYPRAGDSGEGIVVVPGMETIDVSEVDTSLEGHNYFQTNETVLTDLYHLLHFAKPANQRKYLQSRTLGKRAYWAFVPHLPAQSDDE